MATVFNRVAAKHSIQTPYSRRFSYASEKPMMETVQLVVDARHLCKCDQVDDVAVLLQRSSKAPIWSQFRKHAAAWRAVPLLRDGLT